MPEVSHVFQIRLRLNQEAQPAYLVAAHLRPHYTFFCFRLPPADIYLTCTRLLLHFATPPLPSIFFFPKILTPPVLTHSSSLHLVRSSSPPPSADDSARRGRLTQVATDQLHRRRLGCPCGGGRRGQGGVRSVLGWEGGCRKHRTEWHGRRWGLGGRRGKKKWTRWLPAGLALRRSRDRLRPHMAPHERGRDIRAHASACLFVCVVHG